MARLIVATMGPAVVAMMMGRTRRGGIAYNEIKPPIDRRQHEAHRDECAQADHCQHK
jgi:hypothetical protein